MFCIFHIIFNHLWFYECVQCQNNVNVLQISYQKFVEFWWQIVSEVTDDVCFAEK